MSNIRKRILKRFLVGILFLLVIAYLFICIQFYYKQDSLLFVPEKLEANHEFSFDSDFEENYIIAPDGTKLNSLLFKVNDPVGVVFYFSGQGGSLDWWGQYADQFNKMNYDVFMYDYRGFGKSEGSIESEEQFYQDAQIAYNFLLESFDEEEITILGTSMGSGAASWLAAQNNPERLILLSPYYSIPDAKNNFQPIKWLRFIPSFLVKYKFKNYQNIENTKCPVIVMHGDADNVFYYGSSLKLKEHFKSSDRLITIEGGPHHIHHENPQVHSELEKILAHNK